MKRYQVGLTRDSTQSTAVIVSAESKEEAYQAALDSVFEGHDPNIRWETNDCYSDSPYLGDCVENDVNEIQGA